jgi:superfamily I DNA and/or RNA helicase
MAILLPLPPSTLASRRAKSFTMSRELASETFYEGRLLPHPVTEGQQVKADPPYGGVGIRFLPVTHAHNAARSGEEADVVVDAIRKLLGRPWIDQEGRKRKLRPEDIIVVAPYNAQVGEISRRVREALGT